MCQQRRPPPRKIHAPPRPAIPLEGDDDELSVQPLLSSEPTATPDEIYGEDEVALNEFTKLHSICSAEATASSTLQTLGTFCSRQMIKTAALEKISKTWDDGQLRSARSPQPAARSPQPAARSVVTSMHHSVRRKPNLQVGERACVCGNRCVARVMAKMRYGPKTKYPFVMTEFLTPLERETFEKGGGLPARKGKCLLCIRCAKCGRFLISSALMCSPVRNAHHASNRYFTNYLYILAKQDPQFLAASQNFDLQLFENCLALPSGVGEDDIRSEIDRQPHAASIVEAQHGYRLSVLLFADENFVNTCAGRGPAATLAWKPVVRFKSNDYRYEMGDDGEPHIVQVGMGVDHIEETRGISNFRRPLAEEVEGTARGIEAEMTSRA